MKGRMCYIYLTETHSDGVLYCSILLTMAFTSECKADDLSIAAVAVVKAGRAPSSALFRLQDGGGGCVWGRWWWWSKVWTERERERDRAHPLHDSTWSPASVHPLKPHWRKFKLLYRNWFSCFLANSSNDRWLLSNLITANKMIYDASHRRILREGS